MSEWTVDEIDLAAQELACFEIGLSPYQNREFAKAALSAIPRVPEGFWLAPDKPSKEMMKIWDGDGGSTEAAGTGIPCLVRAIYKAMRDVVRGQQEASVNAQSGEKDG